MRTSRAVEESLNVLESFSPAEWREEEYVKAPPFVSESTDGSLLIVPMKSETEQVLDRIHASLGLRRTQTGRSSYLASRNDTIKALRMFFWFMRRSWRDRKYAIVWALAHECGRQKGAPVVSVSLETLVELSGCEAKLCAEVASRFSASTGQRNHGVRSSYDVEAPKILLALSGLLEEAPSRNEEMLMRTLCSEAGASASELYEQIDPHDLTVGALYKTIEGLKRNGYIRTARHFRVNERGPMREYLSSDCRNCFYGFSNPESCLDDAFRQLEYTLKKHYDRDLDEEERTNSRNELRFVPVSPRVLRKAIDALAAIQRMQSLLNERQVASVLGKLEEWYGIQLPVRLQIASNIGPQPD